jgi:SsrA-binding protein
MDVFEAGLVLLGTEVKSIKSGNANLNDAYCLFDKAGNLTLKSMYVGEYEYGNVNNHESRRDRRLLLKKSELHKLLRRVTEKGLTIVPYKLYLSDRGFIKIELWLAQGKKAYDKRDSIKQKDMKREMDRVRKLL